MKAIYLTIRGGSLKQRTGFVILKKNAKFKLLSLLIIIVAFIFSSPAYTQTNSGCKWLHPTLQGNRLYQCKYWNSNTFYAAGELGTFMKTTDGGNTWFITNDAGKLTYDGYYYSRLDVYGMHFFNMNTGITCGGFGLMRTTNAGLNWDSIPNTYNNSDWRNIYFLNDNIGYSVSANGKLIKTTNGGINWEFTPIPQDNFLDVSSPDSLLILVTTSHGSILRSSDGGISWNTISVENNVWLGRISFLNKDTGFVCGDPSKVFMTSNSGVNWTDISSGLPVSSVFRDIDFRVSGPVKEVYITGNQDYIYMTSDFGVSWNSVAFKSNSQIYSGPYQCTDLGGGDTLITCGFYGLFNKRNSVSNAISLSERTKGTAYLGALDIWIEIENGKMWVVGQPTNNSSYDQIAYSSNGGTDWSLQPINNSITSLSTICMLSSVSGYVAGSGGNIFKTTNSGLNWNPIPSQFANNLHKVDFTDLNTGWVFGDAGLICRTTNGGLNWIQQNSFADSSNIWGADMIDANTGWCVLGSGHPYLEMVRKTTDGGITWIGQNANSGNSALFDIKMLNENTGYLGGYQIFRKTTNGGANWEFVSLPLNDFQIQGMDFLDPMRGVIYGSHYHFLTTTDGGTSWNITITNAYGASGSLSCKIKLIAGFVYLTAKYGGVLKDSVPDLLIGTINWNNSMPKNYELFQNFPNPFNPFTTLKFTIPKAGTVNLKVYDITGREVRTIIENMSLNAGIITHQFDGTNLASGIYFYSLMVDGEKIDTKKMILVK